MRLTNFRAYVLSTLVVLERCASVVARPATHDIPYQLYNYEQLNTADQRYWLLQPTANAPKSLKPVFFGVTNSTSHSSSSASKAQVQSPFKAESKYLIPAPGPNTLHAVLGQTAEDFSISLPASAKPILTSKQLSTIVAAYKKQAVVTGNQNAPNQSPPPRFVPDAAPDSSLRETFGNIGTLIGSGVGGPIGIVIGSAIGSLRPLGDILGLPRGVDVVIGTVIGYGIGSNIGGPIGDFIGSRAGTDMAALLKAGSP